MLPYLVIWSPQAVEDLRLIHQFIALQSKLGADKVFDALLDLADSLSNLPNRFPIETYSSTPIKKFRYIPKWNYKIIYYVDEIQKRVIVVRIFDGRQDPKRLK